MDNHGLLNTIDRTTEGTPHYQIFKNAVTKLVDIITGLVHSEFLQHFLGGVQMLISIELVWDFPEGGTPIPLLELCKCNLP